MQRLTLELGTDNAQRLVSRTTDALRRAYEFNQKRFSPADGDDDMSFGVNVWRNATNLLGVSCSDLEEASAAERNFSFEIEIGGATIRLYKMPRRLGDNVDAFQMVGSNLKVAQARQNDNQLKLEFPVDDVARVPAPAEIVESRFSRLVLLHQGNPVDGLRWVVIGAPSEEKGWHWFDKVYDATWTMQEPGIPTFDIVPERSLDIRLKPTTLENTARTDS